MLLCLAYHPGNADFAQAQVSHIKRLCGKLPYPVLFIPGEGASIDYEDISDNITEIPVDFSGIEYPFVGNEIFKVAAQHAFLEKLNFTFLEPDVYVVEPNFIPMLETALLMSGKRAVLTCNEYPPHDLICGVGAYRHDVFEKWIDALNTNVGGWDGAIIQKYSNDICRSGLIFHRYGQYTEAGEARSYEMGQQELGGAVLAHKLWDLKVYTERTYA